MATPKVKLQKFRIQKRFNVWAEKEISAESLEDAVSAARSADFSDFFDTQETTEMVDWNLLPGTTVVGEAWGD